MTSPHYSHLARLVTAPDTAADELFVASLALRDAFVRADHRRGLLPDDAPALLHEGLRRAGEAGHMRAWLELGRLLDRGAAPWAPYPVRDVAASIDAYRRADFAGSRDGARGWIRLAFAEAVAGAAVAAARRLTELHTADPYDPELLTLMAHLTRAGYGYRADAAKAVRFYEVAAHCGDADAALELGACFGSGEGVPADAALSRTWTFRAAELGSAQASASIGGMFATGQGVRRDARAALDWYARAARGGNGHGAYAAGVMCATGDTGVPSDATVAETFYRRAEELGFDVDAALAGIGMTRPPLTRRTAAA